MVNGVLLGFYGVYMNQIKNQDSKELPRIHRWLSVFEDPMQEKVYQEFQWPKNLIRYKLMAFFGFLMSFADPTVYTRGTSLAYMEAVTNTLFFALPYLLRNWSHFQKYHQWYSGSMLILLLSIAMFVGIPAMEDPPLLNPGIFSMFPFTVIIVTYALFPVGILMSSIMVIFIMLSHLILGLMYQKELTDLPYFESYLFPCTIFGVIIAGLLFFSIN